MEEEVAIGNKGEGLCQFLCVMENSSRNPIWERKRIPGNPLRENRSKAKTNVPPCPKAEATWLIYYIHSKETIAGA